MELSTATEHVPLQTGDLIAFSGSGLVSSVIKWATHSPISHVGVMLDDTTLVEAYNGMGENGIVKLTLKAKLAAYTGQMWLYRLTPYVRGIMNAERLEHFTVQALAQPYSKLQAVAAAFGAGQDLSNWCADWYCSKFVAWAYQQAYIIPADADIVITPGNLTKLDIYQPPQRLK